MQKKLGAGAAILALIVGGIVFAAPAQAITFSDPKSIVLGCAGARYTYGASQVDRDNTGQGAEQYQTRVTDGDGNILFGADIRLPLGGVQSGTSGSLAYTQAPTRNPITFSITTLAGNGLPEHINWTASGNCSTLPSQHAPVVVDPSLIGVFGTAVHGSFADYASDADGEELSYAILTPSTHGTLTLDDDGVYSYRATSPGIDTWVVSVSDGTGNVTPMTVTFTNLYSPTLGLTVSPTPASFGDTVTIAAQLSVFDGRSPSGMIEFLTGENTLGTVALEPDDAGRAELQLPDLPAGSYELTARYAGDGAYREASSSAVAASIERAGTSTSLALAAATVGVGDPAVFTATVAGGAPSGNVEFFAGGESLGVVELNGAVAKLETTALPAGKHVISAAYAGDVNYMASSRSPGATLTVVAGGVAPKPEPEPKPEPGNPERPEPKPAAAPKIAVQPTLPAAGRLAATGAADVTIPLATAVLLAGAGSLVLARRRRARP
ncbi:Ig-like domain repeat protein [Leucobacter luti]|uniref:Ig-like domain repeat protein n=1 Tax=Leucobacter luti TaxID=340320 RepID=UPI00105F2EC3|nr:Ig-like domain repeat protein [Leucobacter luti]